MEISNNPSLQTQPNPTKSSTVDKQQDASVAPQQATTQSDRVTLSAEALQKLSANTEDNTSGSTPSLQKPLNGSGNEPPQG